MGHQPKQSGNGLFFYDVVPDAARSWRQDTQAVNRKEYLSLTISKIPECHSKISEIKKAGFYAAYRAWTVNNETADPLQGGVDFQNFGIERQQLPLSKKEQARQRNNSRMVNCVNSLQLQRFVA